MYYSRWQHYQQGTVAIIPLLIATAPFGMLYGTLAIAEGFTPLATLIMSVCVFAGTAQFIALTLIASSATLPIIFATVLLINLRHLLYAASLMPYFSQYRHGQRAFIAFFLSDEAFAMIQSYIHQKTTKTSIREFYFGAAISMYINWVVWSGVGIILSEQVTDLHTWGLEVTMTVAFIAMLVPLLKQTSHWLCVISASLCIVFTANWPYQIGLLISSLIALLVGVSVERLQYKKQSPEHLAPIAVSTNHERI